MAQYSYLVFGAIVAAVGGVVGGILLAVDRVRHSDRQLRLFKKTPRRGAAQPPAAA